MKSWHAFLIFPVLLAGSCSSTPHHLPAAEFRRRYETGLGNTLEDYSYVGETNGAIYIVRRREPLLFGSRPHEKVFFTETLGLTPAFMETVRQNRGMNLRDAQHY